MKRWLGAICGAALLLLPGFGQDGKLTVKDIMKRVNKGPESLFPMVRKGLNADNPDWAALQKQAKEIADLAASLGKQDPPRGEKGTWLKFSKEYAESTKAMSDAAQKMDKQGMIGVHGKLTQACSACHNAHRPQ